jgi:8-hydroxy-5-deazaflavin:NADPH oxidoreductase
MKIGVIGSGLVGQVLAGAFYSEGHEVRLGTRNTQKKELVKFKSENPGIHVVPFQESASFGDLLVLAVRGASVGEVIDLSGKDNFVDKVIIDTTNPIAAAPPEHGVLRYFTNYDESLMERIQGLIPSAKIVKAFNSVGNSFMYKPDFQGGLPTMFICGNDEGAKKLVTDFLTAFGWETEDMGGVEAARAIEPLCMLWCIPGLLNNRWSHAFKLLKL